MKSALVLMLPYLEKPFIVHKDESRAAIGAVLLQKDEYDRESTT